MTEHYPDNPLPRTAWVPQAGEGKNVQALLHEYELKHVLKYLSYVVASWPSLVKRFEKTPAFPAIPTTVWALWKSKELMAAAQGVAGSVSPAQQVRSLKDRISAWQREHPGELLPDDLAQEAYRAPKLKGDKL